MQSENDAAPRQELHRSVRPLFLVLGLVCVVLGYIGYLLPVMPGTVFFIIALWAFKKSSPQLEDWILNRSIVGPTLRDWERDRSVKLGTKILAISLIWISIGLSIYSISKRPSAPVWLVPLLLVVACSLTVYLATRKTKRV